MTTDKTYNTLFILGATTAVAGASLLLTGLNPTLGVLALMVSALTIAVGFLAVARYLAQEL